MTFFFLFSDKRIFIQKMSFIDRRYIYRSIFVVFRPWINWFQSLLTKQRNNKRKGKEISSSPRESFRHLNTYIQKERKKKGKKWLCSSFIHSSSEFGRGKYSMYMLIFSQSSPSSNMCVCVTECIFFSLHISIRKEEEEEKIFYSF